MSRLGWYGSIAALCLAGGTFYAGRLSVPPPTPKPAAQAAAPDPDLVHLDADAQRQVGLAVVRARTGEVSRRLHAQGELAADPARTAELRPLDQGRVTQVLVKPGDAVRRGQTLIVYQDAALTGLDAELSRTRAALTEARAARDVARASLARGEALLGGVVARAEVDRRRVALDEADTELASLGSQVSALSTRQEQYGQAVGAPGFATLAAPGDGYVTAVAAASGDLLDSGRVAVTIADLSDLWLRLAVYQTDIDDVAAAGSVPFTVAALPGRHFSAALADRGVVLDPATGAMWVRCVVPNPGMAFRPGMSAEGDLPTRQSRIAVSVPAAALQRIDGAPAVFVQQGPTDFRMRRVRTGIETPSTVEIADGIAAGDPVVTTGSFWLKSQLLQSQLGAGE